jgi:hypothetical protein
MLEEMFTYVVSWLKLENTNCGSRSLPQARPPPPLPPPPPPTWSPLSWLVMDMIPVMTEDTSPSPVDPGDVEEDDGGGEEAEEDVVDMDSDDNRHTRCTSALMPAALDQILFKHLLL